jgi:Fe2+ or Zn2+ uptake regulation protein
MVQRLAGGGGPARFDAVRRDHLHLRCQRTGELLDAPDDLSARLMQHIPRNLLLELQSRTGFRIDRLQIEAIGEAAGPTPS